MQSKITLKRILAMLLCLVLVLSYLPGISVGAKAETAAAEVPASTATDTTEARSDLLSGNLAYNKDQWDNYDGNGTGLTAEKSSECVFGEKSTKAWAFKAAANAASGAVAQIHMTEKTDLSCHYLMMDVKYVTSGTEETVGFGVRFHNSSWADVNSNQNVSVTAGQWQTVTLIPSETVQSGKDMSDCALMTFSFNFDSTTGAERAFYIDNVRAVKIETVQEDWIKIPVDVGMSSPAEDGVTYEVVTDMGLSSQAMKVYTVKKYGSVCLNVQSAVNAGMLDKLPDLTSGILSGWFWFGESKPSGNVTLTYSDWGTSNTVDFTFENKGNGWYYGTVDCAAFTTTTKSADAMDETFRVDIANLPKKSTIYIDMLNHAETELSGLTISYPFNTENVKQTGSVTGGFEALTFISAMNEVESAQMIMTPDYDVSAFELTMMDLVNENGNVISADSFDVFVQNYVTVSNSRNGGGQRIDPDNGEKVWDAEYEAKAGDEGVFANALIPQANYIAKGENVITAGNNQGIWVNLNVDKDVAPGTYNGYASLTVDGSVMQIPVTVIIRDVTLSDEVHVKSSFQIWWDQLQVGEHLADGNATTARAYENYLISKRLMPYDYWGISVNNASLAEKAAQIAVNPSVSAYAIYTPAKTLENAEELLRASLTTLINKNIALAQSGNDADLFAKAYIYLGQMIDEPRNETNYSQVNEVTLMLDGLLEEFAPMLDAYPQLKESFLSVKHLVTGPDPLDKTYAFINMQDYGTVAMVGDSYAYCPQYQWLNTEAQRARYADQEELWWYGCTHPVNPYPNLAVNSNLLKSRTLGFMMYEYDIDGLLYWCVNSWGSYGENGIELKDYWNSYEGFPGEGVLVLPGSDYGVTGPIGTIRIESLREGLEDYEYLWLLENLTGSDAETATYTDGLYDGVIPAEDADAYHSNRVALLSRLETLSVAANGATVKAAELPTMPVDPQPAPEVVDYPVDIIAIGSCANAAEQSEVTNGDDTAWKITYPSAGDWKYPSIELNKEYDISNHMLVMDIKVTGMESCRVQLANIENDWKASSSSKYLTDINGWNTLTFDLSTNGAGLEEMTKFSLGFDVPDHVDYAIYIDNIYLVPLETVANDWINMAQDVGSFYKNTTTTTVANMLKAQNSGLSMKVVAPADTEGKFTLNFEEAVNKGQIAAKPDFRSGTLGAWFYFGDQEAKASVNITTSSWKGSSQKSFDLAYGGNGWYYGTVDTSAIALPEGGTLEGIIRMSIFTPAGSTVYVDGLTFPNVESVTPIIREDMSADWTNLPATGVNAEVTLQEGFCYTEGSSQALQVVTGSRNAAVEIDVSEHTPDMTAGTVGAWFYFGDATPDASLYVIDGKGFDSSMSVDGPVAFDFGDGIDGWYYGTVDAADILFDELDVEDGASAEVIEQLCIALPANATVYIDCLTFEAPEIPETTEAPATEPPATEPEVDADPGDLLSKAKAADTTGVLGGGNFSYDANATVTYGENSTKSWMFAGNENAVGWPTALLNLGKGYDMSGKVLAFNVKTEGGRGYIAISSLHEAGSWSNVCAKEMFNIAQEFDASDWATVYFKLDDILAEGKSLSNIQFIKFGFDFDTNKGTERKYYIDNVRLLDSYETIEEDWIHMAIDKGDSTASYIKDMDFVKAPDSSMSMKIVSGASDSTWVPSPQGQYGAGIDMTSGILGGYFYFGDAEPSVKVRITDKKWNGGVTLNLTMADAGDGWYYGYVDVSDMYFYADQIANGASAAEIIRVKFTFPANTTVYVDGLMFPTEIPEEYLPVEPEPTEPETTEPETTEPETSAPVAEDLLSFATNAHGTLQTEVTNGSASAWKLVPQLGTEHNWTYPTFYLDQAYAVGKHKLVMDVKPVNMTAFQLNLSTLDSNWLSGVASKNLEIDQWNTVTFDLSASGYAQMSAFGLGMEIVGGNDYAVYIDNVKLIREETLDEDLLNLAVDAGESTANTYEKVQDFTKDSDSGLAMKLIPTADAVAKVSLNVNHLLGDDYDMSTGVLSAWFYFGDQTPSASTNFSGNWKASVAQSWSFGAGVNGWYYGKIDLSVTTFYETAGTMADVERIRITIPAGYEPVYVDYLTYDPQGGTIADEANDMLSTAHLAYDQTKWVAENGLTYGKEYFNVSNQSSFRSWYYKAVAEANTDAVAQMHLNKSYNATGKVLLFDVKLDAPEGTGVDIKVRFHNTDWADITQDKTLSVEAGNWTTVKYDPTDLILAGKDLTDVTLITFTFNFAANTGVERTVYIDNVRLVTPETVEQDWINISQDTGSYYCNSEVLLTDEKVKAEGSTLSLKAVAPADVQGKFAFHTESMSLDLSNGTLGAWFYFGDAEPKASVTISSNNWKASVPASFVFGEGEDGWYYGTVDTSMITFYEDADLIDVRRIQINFLEGATIYVDGLTYTESKADVSQWNVNLEDDLKINFHVSVDEEVAENAQILITVGNSETVYYNVSELTANEEGLYEVSAYTAAAQMTDKISVQVISGKEVLLDAAYSISGYAADVLANEEYSAYHAIVKEMLNYGAAAQTYFGYNTENLANAGIEGVGANEVPEAAGADMSVSGKAEGISFYAASLVYKNKVAVRFYFNAESIDGLTFTANGKPCVAVKNGDYYMVEIDGINPQDLDEQVIVIVTDAQGNSLTVNYGPMNYIVRMNAKGSDSLKALLKAMYNYHLAAETLSAN